MNAILGSAGVALSLAGAILGMITVGVGLQRKRPEMLRAGARYGWLVFGGAVLAVFAMERALIQRDYEIEYVANVGSRRTPQLFNVAALWSALEGSLLLWGLVLAGYLVVVIHKFRKRLEDPLVGWALVVMFAVTAFMFLLLVVPANPFTTIAVEPGYDGPGPNPLLQNHWLMAIHPPMLYLGYVGFTVPFSFAVAALITGRVGEGWLLETRRWTLFAWAFLTFGILLGAWWSYDVLGWGGYWGWDPVENASLVPWLTGTAFLHSVMVQERRGMLRVWNLSLVCATFALTILATFITRAGILDSVHAFSESDIGSWLLIFFGVIVALTVGLVGWRGESLRSPGAIDSPISREGAFLANNLLFAGFAFVIMLGTLFPLLVEAFNDERISVGAPYFNRMSMPIGLVLLFLMAVAPVLPWRKASGELLAHRLQWPMWFGAGALVFSVLVGARGWAPLLAFGLGGFAGGAALRQLFLATRRQGWRGLVGRANGGMVVHLGIILIAVAFAASNSYLRQSEFALDEGETVVFGDHTLTYLGRTESVDDVRIRIAARIDVDGSVLEPSVNRYIATAQSVGEPDTRTTLAKDIQLALLDIPDEDGDGIVVRATEQPLIVWLWIGGAITVIGTAFSAFPGKLRRRGTEAVSAPIPNAAKLAEDEEPSVSG